MQVQHYGTALHVNSPKDIFNTLDEKKIIVAEKLSREFTSVLDEVSGIIVESDEMSSSVVLECDQEIFL